MRKVDIIERRARLARRHRLSPQHRAVCVEDAADSVIALHATDQPTIYLSARARVDGLTHAEVDTALYDARSVVKHLCMRRTLFVFTRDLLGPIQAAASARVAATESKRLANDVERGELFDDGTAWLADARAATLAALAELGSATSSELKARVPLLQGYLTYAPHKSYGGRQSVAPRVMTTLPASGDVLRGINRANWTLSRPEFTLTSDWLGQAAVLPAHDDAIDDMVARWLMAFGPGTLTDIKWWFGSTLTIIRGALGRIGAVEVDVDGHSAYLHRDDLEVVEPVDPYAALLPALDPTTMGWFDREWYLGPHRQDIFDSNGNGGQTAWWDGRIVGGWSQTATGEVVVQPLEELSRTATRALDAEAARLTQWFDGVRIRQSFPSPLSRRSLG